MPNLRRIKPAPFDVELDGDAFMLDIDAEGNFIYSQTKMPFSRNVVTPAGSPYALADPKIEAPRGFFSFEQGMGFFQEDKTAEMDTPGYRYGLWIDSGNGFIQNGPTITTVTPNTTGGIKRFFEFTVGGTRKVCALASRYVLVRDADSGAGWVVSKDLGSSKVASRIAVFRGTQSTDFAFVAQGTGTNFWMWNGTDNTTTWTQASEKAIAFETDRDKLWMLSQRTGGANNGYILRQIRDGGTAYSASGDFVVSDLSNPSVDLALFDDRLFVATERGLFAPSVESMQDLEFRVDNLTPAFAWQRDATNGLGMTPWYQYLIVPMGKSLFRYSSDGSFPEFGLGTLLNNTSEVQGVCTAVAGYRNWTMFAAFYNATEDASYLMRWGNWHLRWNTYNKLEEGQFIPGWHGALAKFPGVQIDALFVSDAQGGNPRLWIGDDDGNIHYITLPRYSMNWTSDSNCTFNTTNPGEVYFPRVTHGIPIEVKTNLGLAVVAENLSGTARYLDVTYRTTPTGSFGGGGNLDGSGRFDVDPGSRQEFSIGVSAALLDLKATLTTTTAATPVILKTIVAYQAVRPTFKWIYQFAVRLGAGVVNRSAGVVSRFFGETSQFASLETSASTSGPVSFTSPRGESKTVIVTDIGIKAKNRRTPEGSLEWVATIEAVEHQSVPSTGSYGHMEAYTYASLEAHAYESLEVI